VETRPPRVARWLLGRLLPRGAREFVIGDLDEEYARHVAPSGRFRARAWYWSHALRSILQTRDPESVMPQPDSFARPGFSTFFSSVPADFHHALRALRASPGYTAAAVLTLGLGIGATVAIFSAINDTVLRPYPFADPERIVALWESNKARGWNRVEAAPANIEDWRARARSFSDIAFANAFPQHLSLVTPGGPKPAAVAQVSGNLFSVLGVPPMLGRTFREDETFTPGLVMLSHRTWVREFAAAPDIVGRTIRLDGRPHEVIGVMGAAFEYPLSEADVWITSSAIATRRQSIWWRQAHVVRPVARLAPGASIGQASAELSQIAADLARQFPNTNTGMEAGVGPLRAFLVGDRALTLWLLLAAVGVLQLIACTNVANLMLSRSALRQQELALRIALGAGRMRLVRHALAESVVLTTAGVVLGLAIGFAGLHALGTLYPPSLDSPVFRLDVRLVVFVLAVGSATAILAGLWPAWRAARTAAAPQLVDGGRSGTAGRRRLLAANTFVAFEVALAVLLVVAAGLMVRSLDRLRRIQTGVDVNGVLTFQVRPSAGVYPDGPARARFAFAFEERLASLPGVAAVGTGRGLPLSGYGWSSDFTIDRWEPGRFGVEVRHREATGGYFAALRVPLIEGRLFDSRDSVDGAPVPVVVNQAFVDRYFPNESPVGRRVAFDRTPTDRSYWYPIVGIVGNERKDPLRAPVPEIIGHLRGDVPGTLTFVMRTAAPPESLVGGVRSALSELDREAPLLVPRSMEEVAAASRAETKFLMTLFSVFAAKALVLAAIGVFGVASQAARARTREVGIRLALGATGAGIVRSLVLRGARFAAAGLVVGVAASIATGRFLETLLFEVEPHDPLTLAVVVAIIGCIAIAATFWPTWRSAQVDPASVLRSS
jgi:putative ABC transport system permease protein